MAQRHRVLKELGLLERVEASSGPNRHFLVRSTAGPTLMNIGLGHFEVPALCTRRSDLLDALISALPAEDSSRPRFCIPRTTDIRRRNSFSGGVSAEHGVVIGADGIRSRVRSQILGVHRTRLPGLHRLARPRAPSRGCPDGFEQRNLGTRQALRHSHTGGDRFTWYATANTDADHLDSPEGRRHELLRMFAGWHEPVESLIAGTGRRRHPEKRRLRSSAAETLGARQSDVTRGRRSSLHAEPRTGRLHGARRRLGPRPVFLKEAAPELALRRYESLRRRRTGHVQQRSLLMGHIGQWDNLLVAAGREG